MRKYLSLLFEFLIVLTVPMAWCMMAFRLDENGVLSAPGLSSMKYFTVLSNMLAGAASLCCLILLLTGKRRPPLWALRLRLIASSAVSVTFLTVAGFLGPVYGYKSMYLGANLWFHLLIPLASVISFPLLPGEMPLTKRDSLLCALPVLLYGAGYLFNIALNGRGTWPKTNDWYGFLNWGLPVGLLIFVLLTAVAVGVGALLRFLNTKFVRERTASQT